MFFDVGSSLMQSLTSLYQDDWQYLSELHDSLFTSSRNVVCVSISSKSPKSPSDWTILDHMFISEPIKVVRELTGPCQTPSLELKRMSVLPRPHGWRI